MLKILCWTLLIRKIWQPRGVNYMQVLLIIGHSEILTYYLNIITSTFILYIMSIYNQNITFTSVWQLTYSNHRFHIPPDVCLNHLAFLIIPVALAVRWSLDLHFPSLSVSVSVFCFPLCIAKEITAICFLLLLDFVMCNAIPTLSTAVHLFLLLILVHSEHN